MFGATRLSFLQIGQHFDGLSLSMFEFRLDLLHDVHDHLVRGRGDLFHEEHVAAQGFHSISSREIVELAMFHHVKNTIDHEIDLRRHRIRGGIVVIRTDESAKTREIDPTCTRGSLTRKSRRRDRLVQEEYLRVSRCARRFD